MDLLNGDVAEPASWHRRLCWVNEWLAVSGDLPAEEPDEAKALLRSWVDEGVTDILDLRDEWEDIEFVAEHAPGVRYHWLGTHDEGGAQSDSWYDDGVAVGRSVREAGGRLLVHCHMGVNRAPSMAFRLLLDTGVEPVEALMMIRGARPVAATLYADSALDHYHRRQRVRLAHRVQQQVAVGQWVEENPVDVSWIISRIRLAEGT